MRIAKIIFIIILIRKSETLAIQIDTATIVIRCIRKVFYKNLKMTTLTSLC